VFWIPAIPAGMTAFLALRDLRLSFNAYVHIHPCRTPRLEPVWLSAPRHALPGRTISSLLRLHIQGKAGRLR